MDIEERCKNILLELGLASETDEIHVTPLTGGVSSDIACIEFNNKKVCVKFALEKLKVSEDWHAPIKRNQAEYQWLEFAHSIVPESTPVLLGRSSTNNAFAMEFIQGDDAYLWKSALLNAEPDQGEAEKIGNILGQIHSASAGSETIKNNFQNQQDFVALRLEPYLGFTAGRHPELSDTLHELITMLNEHEFVLVHGDVSPKNIIFRSGVPVLLDAECATIGDPCFDVAFCLNHLFLKAIHIPESRRSLLTSVEKLWEAYAPHISWESNDALEQRICRLLPALMLARIDGKSPVEYLSEESRDYVRNLAIPLIKDPSDSLAMLVSHMLNNLEN